jgi:hypothetical protein
MRTMVILHDTQKVDDNKMNAELEKLRFTLIEFKDT